MKQSYIKVTEPNSMKFGADLPLTMKCKIMLLNLHRSLIVFLLSFSIQTVWPAGMRILMHMRFGKIECEHVAHTHARLLLSSV